MNESIEAIELTGFHDMRMEGLGFALTGTRTSGVFIKSIAPGTISHLDGRLKVGDQLLKLNGIDLIGLAAEQVARIVRQINQGSSDTVAIVVIHPEVISVPNGGVQIRSHNQGALSTLRASVSDFAMAKSIQAEATPTSSPRPKSGLKSVIRKSQTEQKLVVPVDFHREKGQSSNGRRATATEFPRNFVLPNCNPINQGLSDSDSDINRNSTFIVNRSANIQTSTSTTNARIHFSPKSRKLSRQPIGESLDMAITEGDEMFKEYQKGYLSEEIKSMFNSPFKRIPSAMSKQRGTDQLPLVSFDQLSHSPSIHSASPTLSDDSGRNSAVIPDSPDSSRATSDGSHKLSWSCPVCLDGANRIRRSRRKLMTTNCGHVFCDRCVNDIMLEQHKTCPTCRSQLQPGEIHPIFM